MLWLRGSQGGLAGDPAGRRPGVGSGGIRQAVSSPARLCFRSSRAGPGCRQWSMTRGRPGTARIAG
jgi:hypothetical protein